jgi:putative oxidoreductase
MALGKFRRLAALALIGSIIPTTYAGHRFWEERRRDRAEQRVHFLKSLALLRGLILEAFDTEGAPSLASRATHGGGKRESPAPTSWPST